MSLCHSAHLKVAVWCLVLRCVVRASQFTFESPCLSVQASMHRHMNKQICKRHVLSLTCFFLSHCLPSALLTLSLRHILCFSSSFFCFLLSLFMFGASCFGVHCICACVPFPCISVLAQVDWYAQDTRHSFGGISAIIPRSSPTCNINATEGLATNERKGSAPAHQGRHCWGAHPPRVVGLISCHSGGVPDMVHNSKTRPET